MQQWRMEMREGMKAGGEHKTEKTAESFRERDKRNKTMKDQV